MKMVENIKNYFKVTARKHKCQTTDLHQVVVVVDVAVVLNPNFLLHHLVPF